MHGDMNVKEKNSYRFDVQKFELPHPYTLHYITPSTFQNARDLIYMVRDFKQLPRSMRIALFWSITQRALVITYRRFGTTYR
jgi:hypothetical protein